MKTLRRIFVKNTLALSAAGPFVSSFAQKTSSQTPQKLENHDGTVVLKEQCFPFTQKIILTPGQVFENGQVYSGKELFLPLEHLDDAENFYFLTAEGWETEFSYRIFSIDASGDALSLRTELNHNTCDTDGRIVCEEKDLLYLADMIQNKMHFFFFSAETLQLKVYFLNKENLFQRAVCDDFFLPNSSSLHRVPPELFSGISDVFLMSNYEEKSHIFLHFQYANEDFAQWTTLLTLEDNQYFHGNWTFQYAPVVPVRFDEKPGDRYAMTLTPQGYPNPIFLVHKADNTLGALEFSRNPDESIAPQILTTENYDTPA